MRIGRGALRWRRCVVESLALMLAAGWCVERGAAADTAVGRLYGGRDDDPCYSGYREPKYCLPTFVNAAFKRPVQASSTCGASPARLCQPGADIPECSVCDQTQPKFSHPAAHITDLDNPRNVSCWKSDLFDVRQQPHNVSLTIALGKKFEVTYVSVLFCGMRADSFAIYKSSDYGQTWRPFQYYSSRCMETYGVPPDEAILKDDEQRPVCTESLANIDQFTQARVNFSPLQNRPSMLSYEHSPVLQDWTTATDLKIELHRLSSPNAVSTAENDFAFFSVRDLVVGGRCNCNGHASKCVIDSNGELTCVCKHNTAGKDCDHCKAFHLDRPWARATPSEPFECKACNCNLHATKCRFDKALFLLSGRKGGGVCVNCRHNTAGRYCHYCQDGFYRDYTKPVTHKKVCKPCGCHPIGAVGASCNQTTGQCFCKEGVAGLRCNRCAVGYQQSRSAISPCIKVPGLSQNELYDDYNERDEPTEQEPETTEDVPNDCQMDEECAAHSKKISLKKFCNRDFAIKASIRNREIVPGDLVKLTVEVQQVFKESRYTIKRGQEVIWMSKQDMFCKCPKLRTGATYLLMGSTTTSSAKGARRSAGSGRPGEASGGRGAAGLLVNRKSVVLAWQDDWMRRIKKFQRQQRDGECGDADSAGGGAGQTARPPKAARPDSAQSDYNRYRRYYYSTYQES